MVDRRIISEKVDMVEKSAKRVINRRGETLSEFSDDEDRQDSVVLHLMQAIQGCIDLASHIVSDEELGLAASTRDFFYILSDNKVITAELREKMIRAVGFRNLSAHEYAKLDLVQVYEIATNGIKDLEEFVGVIVRRFA
jgi:uncharacterized protein YutE (UPF0331/DUF86 family)